MKSLAKFGIAAALALSPISVTAQPQDAPVETKVVDELVNRWLVAFNTRDRKALGALYTADARLYLHGHPSVSGRKNIEEFWSEDMKVDAPMTVLNVTHTVPGFDMTLVHGNYQVLNRVTGIVLGHGRFAHIWVRNGDGDWQLDRDLWNQPPE